MPQHPRTAATGSARDLDAALTPPTAPVNPVTPRQHSGEAMWFSVSPLKLVVMCTVTLQFYSVYWFYMQWALVRDRERSSILPAARAIFPLFFIWSLASKVRGAEIGDGPRLSYGGAAAAWLVCTLMGYLPGAMWWGAMVAPLFLIPIQSAMNATNRAIAPDLPVNRRFTGLNWIGIVLGTGMLVLEALGTHLEATQR